MLQTISQALIFSFFICGIIIGCGGSKKAAAVMTVGKGTFEIVIPAFGELQAVKSTPIMVPTQTRGRQTIAWMAAENSVVKKGETVIRMDAAYYTERIQAEEFEIAKLDLQIRDKEKTLGKEKKDLKGQLTVTEIEKQLAELYSARDETIYSRSQVIEDSIDLKFLKTRTRHLQDKTKQLEQKAHAELQLLKSKRKTHRVRLEQHKSALDSLELKAPHDGILIYEKNWRGEKPRLGMSAYRGMKLAKLPDLSEMEAKVYVLESEAAGLKEELSVRVSLDSSPGMVFTGTVTGLDTIAKPVERESPLKYFEVKVSLEKTDGEIMKPGSQVKASIFAQRQEDVLTVPNQALFFDNGQAFVHVMKGAKIEKRPVTIGVRSLTRTVITGGLTGGEKVVLGNEIDI